MTKRYMFAEQEYNTLAEAQAAAAAKRDAFDNEYSVYARIKRLGGSEEAGWQVPVEDLTDSEISVLEDDDANFYAIHSPFDGETTIGLTVPQLKAKIVEYKKAYATLLTANKIVVYEEVDTDIDMTDYINSN